MGAVTFDDLGDAQPFSEDEAKGALNLATSGATITSQQRSQADNARVGGVPNSMHLTGQAMDFVLPPGTDAAAVRAELERQGYPVTEWLAEHKGDPHSTGEHMHWGWGQKGGAVTFHDLGDGSAQPQNGPVTFTDLDTPALRGAE